ncbi:MAG: hypothetical protein ACW99Q_26625, partial [Candidatus Kariarchaeaceae archaeon]
FIQTLEFELTDTLEISSNRLIVERGEYIQFFPLLKTVNWSIPFGQGEIRLMNDWIPVNLTFPYENSFNYGIPISTLPGLYTLTFWFEQEPSLTTTIDIRVVNPVFGSRTVDTRVSGSKTAIVADDDIDLSIYAHGNLLIGDTSGFDNPTSIEIRYSSLNVSVDVFNVLPSTINEISVTINILLPENLYESWLDIQIIIHGNSIFQTAEGNYRVQVLSDGETDSQPPELLKDPILEEFGSSIFLMFNTTEASIVSVTYGRTFPLTSIITIDVYQSSFKLDLIDITEPGSYDFFFEFNDSSGNNYIDNNDGFYYTLQVTLLDIEDPVFITTPITFEQDNQVYVAIYTDEPVSIRIGWGYFFGVYNYYSENLTLDTHHILAFSNPSPGIEAYWVVWITDNSGNEADPYESPISFIFPVPLQNNLFNTPAVNTIPIIKSSKFYIQLQ